MLLYIGFLFAAVGLYLTARVGGRSGLDEQTPEGLEIEDLLDGRVEKHVAQRLASVGAGAARLELKLSRLANTLRKANRVKRTGIARQIDHANARRTAASVRGQIDRWKTEVDAIAFARRDALESVGLDTTRLGAVLDPAATRSGPQLLSAVREAIPVMRAYKRSLARYIEKPTRERMRQTGLLPS